MTLLDWLLLTWLVIEFVLGARIGLVYRLGNLLGIFIGVYLAGHYYDVVATMFHLNHWSEFGIYFIVLVSIIICAGLTAVLFDKIFRLVSWLPLLQSSNRLLGGVVGLFVHALFLSAVLIFLSRVEITPAITIALAQSWVAHYLINFGSLISWLLPTSLLQLVRLF